MFGVTYEHDLLRKFSVIFGALFNDVYVTRLQGGTQIQKMKVPIGYGPKEKFLARVNSNPEGTHESKPAITLPRLAFQMGEITYDPTRKLQSLKKISNISLANNDIKLSTWNPVPYNVQYTLWVMVKSATDGTRILEQILPIFKPQYTVEADLLPTMAIEHDIPIVLQSVKQTDEYEGDWITRRQLIWTLDFTLKGYLYGAIQNSGLIKLAQTHIYASMTSTNAAANIYVRPGLTANGEPTTDPALTVPYTQINEGDNWDYIVEIDEDV